MTSNNLSTTIARHLREVHFGGNWTWSSLKQALEDVTWEEAIQKMDSFNTIAGLTNHISFYVHVTLVFLKGEELVRNDDGSFNHPPINSKEDWDKMLDRIWSEAEEFARIIEKFPDEKLWEIMVKEKYGTYCRNFIGNIEHFHYHLGQIVIIKKMIRHKNGSNK